MAPREQPLHAHTRRIEQTLEAARCSIERLARLRAAWELRPPDQRTLDVQTEIMEEMVVASAFHRQAVMMIARARRGPIFVTTWESETADHRRSLGDAEAWLESAGIRWSGMSKPVQ